MKIETREIIDLLKPFRNGCSYKLLVKADGNFVIKFGCYHLLNLQTGVGQYLQQLIFSNLETYDKPDYEKQIILNQDMLVSKIEEVKIAILEALKENCGHCGSPLFEANK